MQFTPTGFPIIEPVFSVPEDLKVKRFTLFDRNTDLDHWLHFYQEDHKFNRVWNKPEIYLSGLKKYPGVFSPDFSLYTDTPIPLQMWNHYRKQWCGAYWQSQGITVVPTIGWSSEESFTWCFDGIPEKAVVSVSASGIVNDKEGRIKFISGYEKMLEALEPVKVLFFSGARLHKALPGPIQYIGNTKVIKRN